MMYLNKDDCDHFSSLEHSWLGILNCSLHILEEGFEHLTRWGLQQFLSLI